ncbi:hypothetical protein F8O01_11385 [Pseudoclavibacter chungangensis]|uniref:Uncharacterized protein n=1 Tax=Pseudoclavibacter chungangensis TaxID=587635 RepID=A0A7J5BQE4_9MICO|nr:hypothetical protein [Pseudoclavibacter chungangensis]KAB1656028.1 hypothetical protein F8O01_11385 [Pseudoclavibacter chungangensis]NYJ66487.1 hypothetical protein [Pseudoclavibacter chungangensis]
MTLLVSAAMHGPAGRKYALLEPGLVPTVALVAGAIALLALLLALVLRPPDRESARIGETVSVLVGVFCAAILVHRLLVGANDDRGYTPGALGPSLTTTGVAVPLVSGIAIRADIVRRRPVASAAGRDSTGSRVTMRRLREDAAWAATAAGTDEVSARDRAGRLDALAARGSDPSAVAQAGAMNPRGVVGVARPRR